jgi:peptidoglycan/LPS O-acetylase OafA/YrhL
MPAPVEWFFKLGHLGVPIFFVLSGFVIAHSIGKDRVTPGYFGRFILRRSLRLDPPYWASIVLMIAMMTLAHMVIPFHETGYPTWGNLLAHLFYLQGLLGYPQINAIYWTLCIEIQFYLVFCALIGVSQLFRKDANDDRSLRWLFAIGALVSLIWPFRLAFSTINPGLFLPFWHGFLLGAFAYWAFIGRIKSLLFYLYAATLVLAASLYQDSFTLTCVLVSALLLEVGRAGRLHLWLNWRWLQFAGLISYSLYLVHNPITGAAFNVGYRLTGRSPATEALWLVLVVLIDVAVAYAFWYLIERTSTRWSKHVKLKP